MAFNMSVLGGNLKKYRTSRKMTQQELADRLLVSAQSVSKWECGQSVPELDKLCAVAELLNVSLDALLEDTASRDRVLIGVDGGGTKTLWRRRGDPRRRSAGREEENGDAAIPARKRDGG